MKICFYCSYNLSPTGYQKITLDSATEQQQRGGVENQTVITLLTHGGARAAFGREGAECYFVIKGMKATCPHVPPETPGHSRYLNLGVSAPDEEMGTLCALAYAAFTGYKMFVRQLADCITPQTGELSYVIDVKKWRRMAAWAEENYRVFLENGMSDFSGTPGNLPQSRLTEALELLRRRDIQALYEFVLLDGDADYFRTSCNCDDLSQPVHSALMDDTPEPSASAFYGTAIHKSKVLRLEQVAAGLVLCVIVAGVVYLLHKGAKAISRRKERHPCAIE